MNYSTGTITVDSTGSMADATTYEIDYLYYTEDEPEKFAYEFDATNNKFVIRLFPSPSAVRICSLLYEAIPSDLSGSQNPIWPYFEFALERGGIYYGSLEIIEDVNLRMEFKQNYEIALQSLIQLDMGLNAKHFRIPVRLKSGDY